MGVETGPGDGAEPGGWAQPRAGLRPGMRGEGRPVMGESAGGPGLGGWGGVGE